MQYTQLLLDPKIAQQVLFFLNRFTFYIQYSSLNNNNPPTLDLRHMWD